MLDGYAAGLSFDKLMQELILSQYDDRNGHHWCHTISNAMIVTAALLYGGGDYGRTICLAVQSGFDTDCNGATAGSILGMICGAAAIPEEWSAPVNGLLDSTIFGAGTVSLDDMAESTLSHISE